MKQLLKTLFITIIILLITGCKDKTPIEPTPKTLNELIREKSKVVLSENMQLENEISSFSITGYSENIGPAITYDNTVENEELKVSMNLSNEINIRLNYYDSDEVLDKVLISDIKIETKPQKGTLKFYAIVEGDNSNYIDLMRKNEITEDFLFEKDLFGKSLKDGQIDLIIAPTLESIIKTSYENLNNKTYKEVLQSLNIKTEALKFKISFNIIIYTDKNIYGLPIEYDNLDLDVYSETPYKNVYLEKPIYFEKIKEI